MAEVQRTTLSGMMTQQFIQFVMLQSQQASLFLGRIPHPQTGKTEIRLETAKLFISQLQMIKEKTRGNLSQEESDILEGVLTELEKAYSDASGGQSPTA